jgi:hypothetical protein
MSTKPCSTPLAPPASIFLVSELNRLSNSQLAAGQLHTGQREMNAALAAIDGTRPENEMAAMLASQMAATPSLAMDMLGRTRRAGTPEQMQAHGALATKLLRSNVAPGAATMVRGSSVP